jgi:hypothetical protein
MSKSIAVCCCECHNSLACLIVFYAALYQRPSISPAELNEFVYFASLLAVSSRVSKRTGTKRKTIKQDDTIHNHILEVVEESSKYLGVTISKDLIWNAHINKITKRPTI